MRTLVFVHHESFPITSVVRVAPAPNTSPKTRNVSADVSGPFRARRADGAAPAHFASCGTLRVVCFEYITPLARNLPDNEMVKKLSHLVTLGGYCTVAPPRIYILGLQPKS